MSAVAEQIKWEPMRGWMTPDQAQTLGIAPLPGRTYHAMWFFGRPLICQQERGHWTTMSEAVQHRALIGAGLEHEKPEAPENIKGIVTKDGVMSFFKLRSR